MEALLFPLTLGDFQIDRVEELGGIRVPISLLLDDLSHEKIIEKQELIQADCYDFETREAILTLQAWIVRTPHHTVLIDGCAGNHKPRPHAHWIHQLNTPWLDRLLALGISVEQIDVVMCTHLHADHVGWNTRLVDGQWVPTFPNAKYIFGRKEYEHWKVMATTDHDQGQKLVFYDSVLPCVEAGAAMLVEDGFTIDHNLWVEAAPGHTVGHAIVRAEGTGGTALFIGDVMHTPL
jgi:glyoxylase-like metal-dependent hydrolase (beta-lactamase superfamily II)